MVASAARLACSASTGASAWSRMVAVHRHDRGAVAVVEQRPGLPQPAARAEDLAVLARVGDRQAELATVAELGLDLLAAVVQVDHDLRIPCARSHSAAQRTSGAPQTGSIGLGAIRN